MKRFVRSLALAGAVAAVLPSSATVSAFPATVGGVVRRRAQGDALLDATSNFQTSTESEFDHMLELNGDATDTAKPRLTFHWNDPVGNTITCRLIHRAESKEIDAGWLGFAVYDTPLKGVPGASDQLMVGSQAIIGNVATSDVSKYVLGGKLAGPGGVERMEESFQSLIPTDTSIVQHAGDDGHVTTILTFEKLLMENDSAEIALDLNNKNTFLYAVGPPPEGDGELGFHVLRGGFTVNFAEVTNAAASGGAPSAGIGGDNGAPTEAPTETSQDETKQEGAGTEAAEEVVPGDNAEVSQKEDTVPKEEETLQDAVPREETKEGGSVEGTNDSSEQPTSTSDIPSACKSEDPAYLHTEKLADGLKMHYKLDVWSDKTAPTLSVKLEYSGLAWLGFGISPDGNMIGSEAIIGRPDLALADEEKPLKYHLKGKGSTAVVPMEEVRQTLTGASITQESDMTVMTFTKLLVEDGEHTIEPTGAVNFIWGIGSGETLAYHKDKGSFQFDLSKCARPDAKKKSSAAGSGGGNNRSMWAAHGVIATLAWALATPMAVTTAWFRTLVPSSWIYIHVFGNVSSFFLTLLAFIIAVVSMSMSDNPMHFSDPHHVVGLAMLMLVTFQVMNGFLRPPVEKKDPYAMETTVAGFIKIPGTARELWKLAHRSAGVLLLGTGFWQLKSGMDLFANDYGVGSWKPYFYAYLGIFGAIVIMLKLWMVWEEKKARMGVDSMNPDQRRMGSVAIANGVDPDSELVPVQFDIGMQ